MSIWWEESQEGIERVRRCSDTSEITSLKINKWMIVKTGSHLHIMANHLPSRPLLRPFPLSELLSTPGQLPGLLGSWAFQTSAGRDPCDSMTSLRLFTVRWPLHPCPAPLRPCLRPCAHACAHPVEVGNGGAAMGPLAQPLQNLSREAAGPDSRDSCFRGVICYFRKNFWPHGRRGRCPGWAKVKAGLGAAATQRSCSV